MASEPDAAAAAATAAAAAAAAKEKAVVASDILLPIANVDRIIRRVVPPEVKVGKGAVQLIQECSSEFIAFVTLDTANAMRNDKRKTLLEEDFVKALHRLGFDDFVEFMSVFLVRAKADRESRRGKNKRDQAASGGGAPAKRPRNA